jgi:hypothetical protein
VRLFDFDEDLGAILIERCEPGHGTACAAGAAAGSGDRRLASAALAYAGIATPVSALIRHAEALERRSTGRHRLLVERRALREGLGLLDDLSRTAPVEVLLATDLHAGNVLRS